MCGFCLGEASYYLALRAVRIYEFGPSRSALRGAYPASRVFLLDLSFESRFFWCVTFLTCSLSLKTPPKARMSLLNHHFKPREDAMTLSLQQIELNVFHAQPSKSHSSSNNGAVFRSQRLDENLMGVLGMNFPWSTGAKALLLRKSAKRVSHSAF